ncbi:NAD binding domain of 6-phosphogluconate dehydrogenase-domain-containing protein [Rhodocollybia butyracea]|uniref:3-hydroxyisobutyrate dehydrogenase n=1 Tax=Rhodocollybia butyracea TaxID=206335 RepID=A0A9P5UA52_9AGAR|nr:NAD binding domain of 6-phosphogluconate dehydrogenase-domain-containing protein [Rhodocollybia butyracea]
MSDLPKTFGWVGLGAMGFPMAGRLLKNLPTSCELFIYDVDAAAVQKFIASNANVGGPTITTVSSSREAAEHAECFISIVPEGSHVKSVYLTPERGALAADTAGKLFIDCSTIDPGTSLEVGRAVVASHLTNPPRFYDAPVSGGTLGAEKGTLTFMVGASESDPSFPLLQRIFSCMGTSIHPIGGPSLGLAAKLSNNYLSGMIALATSEAMNLGMRLGVDPKVLSNCFNTSSGGNWVNSTCNPVPGVCPDAVTSKGYKGGFKVNLMKKDMTLAVQAAQEVGAKLVLADAGLGAYTAASEDPNCKDRDSRVVYRWLGGVEPDVHT